MGETTRRVLKALQDYILEHGYSPTQRDLMEPAGLASVSSIEYHITKLRDLGIVTWTPGKVRTLRVNDWYTE